jgi:single-strand DNA-binding protein
MSDINTITLIGRMTRDAELKTTQSGKSVATFSIAVGKTFMQAGEKKEQASFFNCTAWGTIGEAIAQYCKKGHRIGITGELQQRTWEDQSGARRSAVDVVVENFQFLQPREGAPAPAPENTGDNPFSDEDIPF